MGNKNSAVNQFLEGYKCSQVVLEAFCSELDINPDITRKIAIPLAGGSGVGGKCGAVSGALLVIGLKYGFTHPGDPAKTRIIIEKNREFVEKFKAIHSEINCNKLINIDVFSEKGSLEFAENNIKERVCTKFVKDAVEILNEITK